MPMQDTSVFDYPILYINKYFCNLRSNDLNAYVGNIYIFIIHKLVLIQNTNQNQNKEDKDI